jgi:hypothetical protein
MKTFELNYLRQIFNALKRNRLFKQKLKNFALKHEKITLKFFFGLWFSQKRKTITAVLSHAKRSD